MYYPSSVFFYGIRQKPLYFGGGRKAACPGNNFHVLIPDSDVPRRPRAKTLDRPIVNYRHNFAKVKECLYKKTCIYKFIYGAVHQLRFAYHIFSVLSQGIIYIALINADMPFCKKRKHFNAP